MKFGDKLILFNAKILNDPIFTKKGNFNDEKSSFAFCSSLSERYSNAF
jgi:hypothetical protein